jgi:hypothetical protein
MTACFGCSLMDQGTDNATSTKTKGRSILQELQKSRVLLQCPSPCTLKKQIADLALKNLEYLQEIYL